MTEQSTPGAGDAVNRLRKRAQNEQTSIKLNNLLTAVKAENTALREQLNQLRQEFSNNLRGN